MVHSDSGGDCPSGFVGYVEGGLVEGEDACS